MRFDHCIQQQTKPSKMKINCKYYVSVDVH